MIIKDIGRIFKDKRYRVILSPKSINKKILSVLKTVSLPEKVVAELRQIKKSMFYTYEHILSITVLAVKIALDKNVRGVYNPRMAAQLGLIHDLGKSRIPLKILGKSTALTFSQHEILTTHPLIGYILLHYYYGRDRHKYDYISYEHHERLDGSGYPRRLKKVNKYAQLIAVVDVLDALLSDRPYRKEPYTLRAALDALLGEAEKGKINKKIVRLLISYARARKPALKGMKVSRQWREAPPAKSVYGKTVAD